MEKLMTQNALKTFRFLRLALMAGVGFPLILASNAFAQLPAPAVPAEPGAPPPSTAEVERVVVTGSNIPTAEETGPNPVDTYRPQDIEKLGIRNATDLTTFIPQEAGGTVNQNMGNGGDGTVQLNQRGLLPKETLILVIADFYQRTGGLFSRDRDISSNGNFVPFGGFDVRSGNFPGRVHGERLIPSLFFSANAPTPHSAPNVATSPFYTNPFAVPGIINGTPGDGNYLFFNFAAFTPALPPADRQTFYGSFTRDLCDKYVTIFADFKIARSFFDASLAAVPFMTDTFTMPGATA